MSQYTRDQLIEMSMARLEDITGTPEPTDEQVLRVYRVLHGGLYPATGVEVPAQYRSKSGREELKLFRRGIELLYPWVRQDQEVRNIQRLKSQRVDVIPDPGEDETGTLMLHGVKHSGAPEMLRYSGHHAVYGQDQDAGEPWALSNTPEPLHVLLTHLLRIEHVLEEDTPVFQYRYDNRTRRGQHIAVAPPKESAIPLSRFLEEL